MRIIIIASIGLLALACSQTSIPRLQPPAITPFNKADKPSYDGTDLSGYARYLAEEDPANCTAAFAARVRRAARDTFTYQPEVYPADTEEFLSYLREHCLDADRP